jgi:hypothetical protein
MSAVLVILMIVLFFGGIVLLSFSYKSFKQKKIVMGIIFVVIGLFLMIPPTIMIVTVTMVTASIMGH